MSVVSAGGSILGGIGQARSMDAQAKAEEYRAKGLKLQGKQMAAERARDLNMMLGTIDAIRSGRNVSLDSPTAMVIERARKNNSDRITGAEQLEVAQEITSSKYSAKQLKKGKKFAIIGGFTQAAGTLASAFKPSEE
jgi:hypothetical protein